MADSKKYDGNQWEHSLRKLTTATEAVENPLYSDGTAITNYTIKGNTTQSGTPTPSNPVAVTGTGNKTANLFNPNGNWNDFDCSHSISGNDVTVSGLRFSYIAFTAEANTEYTMSHKTVANQRIAIYAGSLSGSALVLSTTGFLTFTTSSETQLYILFYASDGTTSNTVTYSEIMLVKGNYTAQTMPSYEPYGFKIPISSGQTTTPMYLTEPLMKVGEVTDSLDSSGTVTRPIHKFEFTGNETWGGGDLLGNCYRYIFGFYDGEPLTETVSTHYKWGGFAEYGNDGEITGAHNSSILYRMYFWSSTIDTVAGFKQFLAQQYANGTPVTVYYVLPTPTTETVTAPSIPTVDGANQISIDTTVQPSEFTATWTGWHDASVKEYDGSQWQ